MYKIELRVICDPDSGQSFGEAFREARDIAKLMERDVYMTFNSILVKVERRGDMIEANRQYIGDLKKLQGVER